MLIDGGTCTSVEYISNTRPIPANKIDIAVSTALAGEMLGLRQLYLEAGSGAKNSVPCEMIQEIRKNVTIPIIVGGGLRTPQAVEKVCKAGANIVVVGNVIESNHQLISELAAAVHQR
jgi:geranylgeranylglyceryl phosphate synthase family protein